MSEELYKKPQETIFPRITNNYMEYMECMECILCKKQFKITEIDHICTIRMVSNIIKEICFER